ncbi:MAG: branched-chain amino acid aminotransferase, partial [Oscillospiraceae bacterium]
MEIKVELTKNPKQKPKAQESLGFGKYYSDHMFFLIFVEGVGWVLARIVPYAPFTLDPAAMVLHYAQEVFEGMKAYKTASGEILLFRPDRNMARMNHSNERLCIPLIDVEFAVEAVNELVRVDADWIPTAEGTSLYIRPYIFATDPHVGVHPAKHLTFAIILSPVGAYYPEGLNPVKIYVESNFVRAVKGGVGFTKTGGNYATSLKAQDVAEKLGYTQVLWLDGVERKYVEEVGTMNVFFVLDGEVVTPSLSTGSILSGVTR